jgi:predicted Zn-dependent protease
MKTWGWRQELKHTTLDSDHALHRQVEELYHKLQTALGKTLPGKVRILVSDKLKCFLLPTGDLYLSTAALQGLSSEDIVSLLAHQLAHMELQHLQELISYSKPTTLWVKWMSKRDHHTSELLRGYLVSRRDFSPLQELEAVRHM